MGAEEAIAGVIPVVITTGVAMNVYERTLGTTKKKSLKKSTSALPLKGFKLM